MERTSGLVANSGAGNIWVICFLLMLLLLSALTSGQQQDTCHGFLHHSPHSPLLRILRFSLEQRPCGSPVDLPTAVPFTDQGSLRLAVCPVVWSSESPSWMPISPTVMIVPGRRPASRQPSWVRWMARKLLQEGPLNVLVADWLLPPEEGILEGAWQVGGSLAQVIQTLLDQGLSPELIHLIGFGVGAHVSGIAGACLKGAIGRITGLDPFSPEFSEADSRLCLDHTDAQYVDVIHTNFNPNEPLAALGISRPLGHVDFYVGKGNLLPGCPQGLTKRERYLLCSHQWAYRLFTSSIQSHCPHTAIPCPGIEDYQRAVCTACQHPGLNTCPQLGYDIRWLPPDRPINFQPLTAVLDVTAVAPFCVTPFMLEVQLAGNISLEAQIYIQVTGEVRKTPVMLVSGPSLVQLDPHQMYQFMVSIDHSLKEFRSMFLEFNSQRLLYFQWRKRSVQISRLSLIQLPRHKGLVAYNSWAVTAVENQRVEVHLWRVSTREG